MKNVPGIETLFVVAGVVVVVPVELKRPVAVGCF